VLIFIGGAARTGKGILARRLLAEHQMAFLSLDVLKMGLARGVPEYEIDPDAGGIVVGERLWPLVREMSINLLGEGVDYVIEGELLPRHVAAFQQLYPAQTKACFLGYTALSPEQKLRNVRRYAGYPNDWSSEYTDAELLPILTRMIEFSHYLQAECVRYQLRYFDTSHHFIETLDQVISYLCSAEVAEPGFTD
jgi:hypothetical protein